MLTIFNGILPPNKILKIYFIPFTYKMSHNTICGEESNKPYGFDNINCS